MNIVKNLAWSLIIGALLVLPFMALEWWNRRSLNEGYPFPLFVILWLLPTAFTFDLLSIYHDIGAQAPQRSSPFLLVIKVVLLALIAWLWVSIVLDQIPCFFGILNCD